MIFTGLKIKIVPIETTNTMIFTSLKRIEKN